MKEYGYTKNALYGHDCLGHDDLGARQEHYIQASTKEEAWQKMEIRFPDETSEGFTVTEWEGFNVEIFDVCK